MRRSGGRPRVDGQHGARGHAGASPAGHRLASPAPQTRDAGVSSNAAGFEKVKDYLAAKRLRVTKRRLAIFEAAFAQKGHLTAEELVAYARAIDDSVPRATVYRTLPIMTESAL